MGWSIEISKRPHLEIRLSLVGGPELRRPCCPFRMVSHWPALIGPQDIHNSICCPLPHEKLPPLPDPPAAPFCTAIHFFLTARSARSRAGIVFLPWEAEGTRAKQRHSQHQYQYPTPLCRITNNRPSRFRRLVGSVWLLWLLLLF